MRPRLIIIGDVILEDANTQAPTRTFISARGAGWSRSFFCHLTLFCYTERVLLENRNGIMIDLRVGQASGRAESEQGLEMLQELRGPRRIRLLATRATTRRRSWRVAARSRSLPTWRRMSSCSLRPPALRFARRSRFRST